MYPKFYIGPMSQNIVEATIEFSSEFKKSIGLIPSRRQVDWNGGYVNNWTTKEFSEHISNKLFLTRDHAGPEQGHAKDDGYRSLKEDSDYFNMIHIDPWKKYPKYKDGLQWTINMIKFCLNLNPNLEFEIGTEESIRKFTTKTLNQLLSDLHSSLSKNEYKQIKYTVIQSGTSLKENTNIGEYNNDRLISMIRVAKQYGMMTKEHNADYLPGDLIKKKMNLGLDAINIAPEFGQIETKVYLDNIRNKNNSLFDLFYKICYESDKWKKWTSKDFNPLIQKEKLINICGHYILSHKEFLSLIKIEFPMIDKEIKQKIKTRLNELFT